MITTTPKTSDWRRVIARHEYPKKLADFIYHYPTAENRKVAICGVEMNEFYRDTTKNIAIRLERATICEACEALDPITETHN